MSKREVIRNCQEIAKFTGRRCQISTALGHDRCHLHGGPVVTKEIAPKSICSRCGSYSFMNTVCALCREDETVFRDLARKVGARRGPVGRADTIRVEAWGHTFDIEVKKEFAVVYATPRTPERPAAAHLFAETYDLASAGRMVDRAIDRSPELADRYSIYRSNGEAIPINLGER